MTDILKSNPDENADVTPGDNPDVTMKRQNTMKAIADLLAAGKITDAKDQENTANAVNFLAAPTNELADITMHASKIGEILAYMSDTDENYAELNAMNYELQILVYKKQMQILKEEAGRTPVNLGQYARTLKIVWGFGKTIAKEYNDTAPLAEVLALQSELMEVIGQTEEKDPDANEILKVATQMREFKL